METTGKALVEHWEWAATKGLMNKNTAQALRAACSQVLGIEKGWEALDVSEVDVDQLLKRFQNLRGKDFKPGSLGSYNRRFRQALASFLRYAKDPQSWKHSVNERKARSNGNSKRQQQLEALSAAPSSMAVPEATGPGYVDYPFPLREGFVVRLTLPVDLKAAEVKRLAAFMNTLAVDSAQLVT